MSVWTWSVSQVGPLPATCTRTSVHRQWRWEPDEGAFTWQLFILKGCIMWMLEVWKKTRQSNLCWSLVWLGLVWFKKVMDGGWRTDCIFTWVTNPDHPRPVQYPSAQAPAPPYSQEQRVTPPGHHPGLATLIWSEILIPSYLPRRFFLVFNMIFLVFNMVG